jgi:hypothetical protein
MLTKEQLETRLVGGSDGSVILGLSPWNCLARARLRANGETVRIELVEI